MQAGIFCILPSYNEPMKIKKEIKEHELYLYMDGKLIYKKWLNTGNSKVFDLIAYSKYTLSSIRTLDHDHPDELIAVKALIKLKSEAEGGRKTGFISGYRPNHVFEYGEEGPLRTFIGDIVFEGQRTIEPGETKEVTVRFLLSQPIEAYLEKGRVWWLHEGLKKIGEATIL